VIKLWMITITLIAKRRQGGKVSMMGEIQMHRPGRRRANLDRVGTVGLTPVGRETVNDRVYRELRRALIRGLFDPGQVLTIQELATTLQTSTMPVREALSRLISEQALAATPNRSVRVPPVDPDRLEDLLRARIVIEGAALELAAPNLTRAALDELTALVEAHGARPAAIDAQLELNQAFHFTIYQASGSTVLIPIIESLWLQSGPYIRAAALAFDPMSAISTSHYHSEIVTALRRGDVAAARAALATDIGRAFDLLRARPLGAEPPQARRAGGER
jgi:DNA-binding GntR family transcriptional regulator